MIINPDIQIFEIHSSVALLVTKFYSFLRHSNPLNLNNKIDQINLNPLFIFNCNNITILFLIFIFIIINKVSEGNNATIIEMHFSRE